MQVFMFHLMPYAYMDLAYSTRDSVSFTKLQGALKTIR